MKLYQREDVVQQNPEDLDPDGWLDDGELTELLEVPREETEVGPGNNQRSKEDMN